MNKAKNTHDQYVNYLIDCGKSIIQNAESIVGHEELLSDVTVNIYIGPNKIPSIAVKRDFYPEGMKDWRD